MNKEQLQNKLIEYFKELKFETASHTYEVKGSPLTSVSNMIKGFVQKVDFDRIAYFIAKRDGITKQEVLQMWANKRDNSCSLGHKTHDYGENYFEGEYKEPTNGFESAIDSFWKSLPEHLIPIVFELQMYSVELGLAGTSDFILYNTLTGKFIIGDYKTNEDLFKNHKGKTLLKPFEDLLDCPYSKYEIQLSAYQILFEQTGYEVESRVILWLKPDGTYIFYKVQDLTDKIKKTIKTK